MGVVGGSSATPTLDLGGWTTPWSDSLTFYILLFKTPTIHHRTLHPPLSLQYLSF